jgi:hypothetical protein
MGRFITNSHGDQKFIPNYRVTFEFAMLPKTRRVVKVEGNERLHRYGLEAEQVLNAVHQAEIMLAIEFTSGYNLGPKVVKVEREWESEKGYEELICAARVQPGMRIVVTGFGSDHPSQRAGVTREHITVGRWEPTGHGTCQLYDDKGTPKGQYERHDVFVVCQPDWA